MNGSQHNIYLKYLIDSGYIWKYRKKVWCLWSSPENFMVLGLPKFLFADRPYDQSEKKWRPLAKCFLFMLALLLSQGGYNIGSPLVKYYFLKVRMIKRVPFKVLFFQKMPSKLTLKFSQYQYFRQFLRLCFWRTFKIMNISNQKLQLSANR